MLALVTSACAGDANSQGAAAEGLSEPTEATPTSVSPTTIDPVQAMADAQLRAMLISTTRCGDASQAVGSGIALSERLVLTVAHVVAGATEVSVIPTGERAAPAADSNTPATIIAYDPLRDLALLEVDLGQWSVPPPPNFEVLASDVSGTIVQGATSGDVRFTVTEKTIIEMDEVRGTRRSRRSGYLIDAETDRGDSGAGLYDEFGNFAGVLFAVSTGDSSRSWANAADEVQDFLDDESVTGTFACNPGVSKVERLP